MSIPIQKSIPLPGLLSPALHSSISDTNRVSSQEIKVDLRTINLLEWQQLDLNQDAERVHYTATYYTKKGNKLLFIGTCIQFSMLLLSLSGSYISTFGNFGDSSKSILMSCINMTTAILSGIYTFFSFTKKGQSYKEAASILFTKVEKIKCVISTLLSDKEYEDLKRGLVDTLLKYDVECVREKYNGKQFIPVYRQELEQGLIRKFNGTTLQIDSSSLISLNKEHKIPSSELEEL